MDFFQHQDDARKSTNRLVFYFGIAVVAIVVSVYFASSAAFFFLQGGAKDPNLAFDWFDLDRFVLYAGGTLLVISLASLYKTWELGGGGRSVAELLGGRPLDPNSANPQERRLLNIVEEMAIAAGLPVPTVYLMDKEEGINAFAAGFQAQDAVIGVTKGTMEILSRDELQGVIAHEFSHIFNGDMRLNIRLMGVLHGILVLALIGYFILRTSFYSGGGRRRDSNGGGGAAAALPLIGLTLVIVGYTGVFFGRLIKSAVSRQREFLADASAVQFTRNPDGIGGALKKIGGLSRGSIVVSPNAEQASHFFFSDGKFGKTKSALSGVSHFNFLATHPPIGERIQRIQPQWDGEFPKVDPTKRLRPEPERETSKQKAEKRAEKLFKLLPVHLTAMVGTLDQAHLDYAKALLERIPEKVRLAAREPASARAVVLAVIADRDPEIRQTQIAAVNAADALLVEETVAFAQLLEDAPQETRLPLIDLTLPALKRLSESQYRTFKDLTEAFIRADQQIDLFEYALTHVLERHLAPAFTRVKPPKVAYNSLGALGKEVSLLLSALAYGGHPEDGEAAAAFAAGAKELDGPRLALVARERAGLSAAATALAKLDQVSPKLKKELMSAFLACVAHDGQITLAEGELLRTVADALGLPLPPFLPGQQLFES